MAVIIPGKLVYLATPHTGSCATTIALSQLAGAYSSPLIASAHRPVRALAHGTHHAAWADLCWLHGGLMSGEEKRIFTVRNPYDLVVTWFLRVGYRMQAHTLADFLERVQERALPAPYLLNNRMFWHEGEPIRYEALQHELGGILQRIGLPPVTLPTINQTARKLDFTSYHTPRSLAIMRERWGKEIDAYGYHPPRLDN